MTQFVFVHGRGPQGDDLTDWREAFAQRLWDAGIPAPSGDSKAWLEVRYDDLLANWPAFDPAPWPEKAPVGEGDYEAFRIRRSALETLAVRPAAVGAFARVNTVMAAVLKAATAAGSGVAAGGLPGVAMAALLKALPEMNVDLVELAVRRMADVAAFASDESLRRAIVHRILNSLPEGDVVLVAHSLGTVAILEALPFLSSRTTVRLLVTIGSPAAIDPLRANTRLAGDKVPFPSERVNMWLNLVNAGDPVTLGAGLRKAFPLVVDHLVDSVYGFDGKSIHGVKMYLADPIVAHALRLSIGSPEGEGPASLDEPVDFSIIPRLLDLLYVSFVGQNAKEQKHRERCEFLVREFLLPELRLATGRELSLDETMRVLIGWMAAGRTRTERLVALLLLVMSDPFSPFEPDVPEIARRRGLQRLASQLGLTSVELADIRELAAKCREVAAGMKRLGPLKRQRAFPAPAGDDSRLASMAGGAAFSSTGSRPIPLEDLDEEPLVAEALARRAAMVRLLRGVDEPVADDAAPLAAQSLADIEDELRFVAALHKSISDPNSGARAAVEENLRRAQAVRAWLSEKESADEFRRSPAV